MTAAVGVLHLVNLLDVGGTERQLFELLRRLDRDRFRPLVGCLQGGGELTGSLRAIGIEPVEYSLRGSLARPNTAVQAARLALLCRRRGVRILHAHDLYANLLASAAAALGGTRMIASRRDLGEWVAPRQRRLCNLSLRFADSVVVNSRAVGIHAVRVEGAPPERLEVIPNGLDLASFDDAVRQPLAPSLPEAASGVLTVMMVGSMHRLHKGHGDLLVAAARLRGRGRRLRWLLPSDGPLRGHFESQARALGCDAEVHFLGRRQDIPALLGAADLVVHPSWSEGFPNIVMEAMAAARPVIATRVGGCEELITDGETGLLVAPRDPDALALAIETLLDDPARRRALGQRARRHVALHFSLEQMCARFGSLYTRLAQRS